MRVTDKMLNYPSLTDRERFKGIKVDTDEHGIKCWTKSDNKVMTPEIKKLLNDKNNPLIPELKFRDGILHIEPGYSYRVPTGFGGLEAYSIRKDGFSEWKPNHDMPEQNFEHFISKERQFDIYLTNDFLSTFKAKNLDDFLSSVSDFNPSTTASRELQKLGAPKGEFIKISKYDEEFMIDYDNMIFTREDIESLRIGYNQQDCREFNHPPGTIYRIEGKDYVVDENWRLSIPEGVTCTPARVDIIELSDQ
jgi:hypothetical protein